MSEILPAILPRWAGAAVLLLHLTLLGCAPPSHHPRAGEPPIRTEKRVYSINEGPHPGRELRIVATYTNRTGGTVFPEVCGYNPPRFRLEKWVNGAWVLGYSQVCTMPRLDVSEEEPVSVPPGGVYTDTLSIVTNPFFRRGVFSVDSVPGTYRIVYRLLVTRSFHGRDSTDYVPPEQSISNEFRIVP